MTITLELADFLRGAPKFINELTYANYRHNRTISPHIAPERWARIYDNAQAMEERFQKEKKDGNLTQHD